MSTTTTKKTGTTTKEERKLLENAATIILREIGAGQEVHIRGLGRFSVSAVVVNMGGPGGKGERKKIGIVKFRPFDRLKKTVRNIILLDDQQSKVEIKNKPVSSPSSSSTKISEKPIVTKEPSSSSSSSKESLLPPLLPLPSKINW